MPGMGYSDTRILDSFVMEQNTNDVGIIPREDSHRHVVIDPPNKINQKLYMEKNNCLRALWIILR